MKKIFWSLLVTGLGGMSSASLALEWKEAVELKDGNEWQWVDVPESMCRDGSSTGFYLRQGSKAEKLVIFLEGGGACFNDATCGINPENYDKTPPPNTGIFDSSRLENPLKDWNVAYIPYCTGDVHGGNQENVYVSNRYQNQNFVGYTNVTRFMERIAPTFSHVDYVLLTGVSAGGIGALYNHDQVQSFFETTPVDMLDDSGIAMTDEYMAPCLQNLWRELWGLTNTLPFDCLDCTNESGGGLFNLATYLVDKYPDRNFAYASTLSDQVIRSFMGYGRNNCSVTFPYMPSWAFRAGAMQMRDEILNGAASFYFRDGSDHTSLRGNEFYERISQDVLMPNWVGDVINGEGSNLGPQN